jgi:hypothetical protein
LPLEVGASVALRQPCEVTKVRRLRHARSMRDNRSRTDLSREPQVTGKRNSQKKSGNDMKKTTPKKTMPKKTTPKRTTLKSTAKKKIASNAAKGQSSPSQLIDARIEELGDWRGETLARIRLLIKQALPDVIEEWKWRGVPVWYHDGMICTGETYKNVVKVTFAKGAALENPARLFNSSLEGNTRRAIDFHEGKKINEKALKALIRAAVALNASKGAQR